MNRNRYCQKLWEFVSAELSPTPNERAFVSDVYASVNAVLDERNTIQIGSYRRFTAITPMHDLDMLYIIGAWQGFDDPRNVLQELERKLKSQFVPPNDYQSVISRQSHSITISLIRGSTEYFSVDVVPAYSRGINSYGEDMYMVPEIAQLTHTKRAQRYIKLTRSGDAMGWIPSDPRGYNRAATEMNAVNEDFRRATKFLKGWRAFQKSQDDDFKLKSFHLEQLVFGHFADDPSDDIFGAIFDIMRQLDRRIYQPKIPDRADATKFIDEYVRELTITQRQKILAARDGFMIALEDLEEHETPRKIIEARPRIRADKSEQYLFDQGIPILTEYDFGVVGNVRERTGGFRAFILNRLGRIDVDRQIDFERAREVPGADIYKWKVNNDDNTSQPRGEITDHHTLRQPEHAKYRGNHYVECFAIRDGVCIARSRQDVVLNSGIAA